MIRHQRRAHVRQPVDFGYCAIGIAVIVTLVILATVGHSIVSAGM